MLVYASLGAVRNEIYSKRGRRERHSNRSDPLHPTPPPNETKDLISNAFIGEAFTRK